MIIKHWPGKTITESDNNLFSLLTMNHHPVHIDQYYASNEQHGKVLVVGTLVFSLTVGLTVRDISGKAIANLNYSEVLHKGPVHIGDTLYAETEVLDVRPSKSKQDRGVVKVTTKTFNQNEELVLLFTREVLVKRRLK
ncbi:MaoC family dehydratase [Marinilabiliaceae bacterium A049]|nr:MaoC family dehydratase [Marinilabiliaceae bacterium A049]